MTEVEPAGGWAAGPPLGRRSRRPRVGGVVGRGLVVFAYVRTLPGAPGGTAAAICGVEAFARSRGWVLTESFVDDDPARPFLAWGSLLAVARVQPPSAVVVPAAPQAAVVWALRSRLTREAEIPLVAIDLPGPFGGGEWLW